MPLADRPSIPLRSRRLGQHKQCELVGLTAFRSSKTRGDCNQCETASQLPRLTCVPAIVYAHRLNELRPFAQQTGTGLTHVDEMTETTIALIDRCAGGEAGEERDELTPPCQLLVETPSSVALTSAGTTTPITASTESASAAKTKPEASLS